MQRLISEKYETMKQETNARFEELKRNEEELNRIFIEIYGLHSKAVTMCLPDKMLSRILYRMP